MGLISRELHITDVVLHKNFNFTTQLNDIALLRTSELQQKFLKISLYLLLCRRASGPGGLSPFLRSSFA